MVLRVTASPTPHLTAEEVAAFLDRRATATERAGIEAHLADCRECRVEVAAVRRMVRASSFRRPMILLPASLAAAAAIAFVALNIQQGGPGSAAERIRATTVALPDDSLSRLDALAPADGDTIPLERPALRWSSVTGDPTYRLTLTDTSGQTVWTGTMADTSVALPAHVLQPRATYFWYVDVLRADGRAASTGVHSFTTR